MSNQQNEQKQSTPDNAVNDPMKDLVATAGQGQQSGDQGNQQSDQQHSAQGQGGQQSGQQEAGQQQMGSIDQGSMQSEQGGSQQSGQQGGGQHASGGTPALDDLSGKNQNQTAQQASEAFDQQNNQGSGNR